MKKTITLISILLILLGLAACGGAANAEVSQTSQVDTSTASSPGMSASTLSTDYENALPVTVQLVVGTLKLDGTANEVDAKTASELLPLWKAAKSLSSSDSTAPEELDALYKQIEETMTPAQIQAIAAMQLTREDMAQVFQDMGLNVDMGADRFANMTAEQQATAEAARQSGQGFPGGGVPGVGGGAPPDQGFAGGNMPPADTSGQTSANRSAGGIGTAMYEAVIQYLEGKVG